ncbi:MAG TPA: hypothetical protein VL463_18465 [Kofleriaceae bacterium]|jgi:hypothetical protein|nr:hypothetical protein [Kofleriaceae bacterium]
MRLAVIAVLCTACDTGVTAIALGPLDAEPSCEEARTHKELSWIQANIFDKSCSLSTSCHGGDGLQAAGLVLTAGQSYDGLVGVDAQGDYGTTVHGTKQWKRVVAGDPANSYLMVMIHPKAAPPMTNYPFDPNSGFGSAADINPKVGPMPVNGDPLCALKLDAIQHWIEDGAPNN